ncbi:MAG: hypothetical protein WB402_08285 [Sulfuricaulis sp.]|uniref:hypothetical protein n=1 Tax=Sulfuricaulis sp. TaxID=2003553 RepID=UPI003C474858
MKPNIAVWAILTWCALISLAHASNVGFLNETPYFAHFTDEDRKIFHATVDDLLKLGKDQDTRTWTNPKTGANGDLRLLPSATGSGGCRDIEVRNSARGRTGKSVQRFCPDEKGVWKWKPKAQ